MIFYVIQVIYNDGDVEILLLKKERWEFIKNNKIHVVGQNFQISLCMLRFHANFADLICRNKQKSRLILMLLQKSKYYF